MYCYQLHGFDVTIPSCSKGDSADPNVAAEVTFMSSLFDKLSLLSTYEAIPDKIKLPKIPSVASESKKRLKTYRKSASDIIDVART